MDYLLSNRVGALLALSIALVACGDDDAMMMVGEDDSGSMILTDAGLPMGDSGEMTEVDSSMPDEDSGPAEVDSGAQEDAGTEQEDAGTDPDAGGCPEGYAGEECDECADGYYDPRTDGTCIATCDVVSCGDYQSCMMSPVDGSALCVCNEGHEGDDCATCASGFEAGSGGNCELTSPPAGNLALWLDASDADSIMVNDSDQVLQWDDTRSFISMSAVPTAAISRPTYLAEGRNGRGAFDFDGSSDQMKIDGFTGLSSTDFEIVWAGEPRGPAPTAIVGGISGTSNWAVMVDRTTSTDFSMTIRTPAGTTGGETIDLLRNRNIGPMYVFASRQTSGAGFDTYAMWATDSPMDAFEATPSTTGGIASPLTLRIGRTQAGFMQGRVYEILVYTRRLSTNQRDGVRAYLRAKWNLPE